MSATQVRLTDPQFDLVSSTDKYPAFVGGFGSGKTHGLIVRTLCQQFSQPALNQAYYLPTYDLVRQIAFPRFSETLEEWGIQFTLNRNDHEITYRNIPGRTIFRTMDRPERIIGYESADSAVDELDTLKIEDARQVWNKIIARNRAKKDDGSQNTVAVGTTPEGFRFVYERWKRDVKPGYRLIQASTESNRANLPEGYIESLRENYGDQLLSAYLDGEFVNLTSGSVYAEYDRAENVTAERIHGSEPLHIGMDFNVQNMAAVVNVIRDGKAMALDEITKVMDTPAMIELIQSRYHGHHITIYPDQSGRSRKSVNASVSDISLLKQAGFSVYETGTNPAVRDRVIAMQRQLSTRNMLINPESCPQLCMSLEQQVYDRNGEPDKLNGWDHINDAQGYFVSARFPVQRRTVKVRHLKGF